MAVTYLTSLDLSLNELLNVKAQQLASDPGSPVEGQLWYNTTAHALKYRTNSTTITIGAGGVSSLTVDASSIENIGTAADPSIRVKALGITNAMLAGSIANTKLATDPLARANHTGTQLAATISDFDTQVRTSRLDQMAAPTADVSLGSHKLINVTDPTGAQDAATKSYVDAVKTGLDVKDSVRVATTAALAANTRSGNVLTASANGVLAAIDGVTLVVGERLLVKDEGTGANNGIYTVTSVGSGGAPWVLTRATDADASAEVTGGLYTFVTEGTTNADSGWILTTNDPITLNTTALSFTQFSGAGQITAGAGLTKTGNTLDVQVDNASIEINADTLRVKAAGITNAMLAGSIDLTTKVTGQLPIANGGTGGATVAAARTALSAAGIYSTTVGDGASTAITVTHNLGSRAVVVSLSDTVTPYAEVIADVEHTTTNTLTLRFATAPATNKYLCTVIGGA